MCVAEQYEKVSQFFTKSSNTFNRKCTISESPHTDIKYDKNTPVWDLNISVAFN